MDAAVAREQFDEAVLTAGKMARGDVALRTTGEGGGAVLDQWIGTVLGPVELCKSATPLFAIPAPDHAPAAVITAYKPFSNRNFAWVIDLRATWAKGRVAMAANADVWSLNNPLLPGCGLYRSGDDPEPPARVPAVRAASLRELRSLRPIDRRGGEVVLDMYAEDVLGVLVILAHPDDDKEDEYRQYVHDMSVSAEHFLAAARSGTLAAAQPEWGSLARELCAPARAARIRNPFLNAFIKRGRRIEPLDPLPRRRRAAPLPLPLRLPPPPTKVSDEAAHDRTLRDVRAATTASCRIGQVPGVLARIAAAAPARAALSAAVWEARRTPLTEPELAYAERAGLAWFKHVRHLVEKVVSVAGRSARRTSQWDVSKNMLSEMADAPWSWALAKASASSAHDGTAAAFAQWVDVMVSLLPSAGTAVAAGRVPLRARWDDAIRRTAVLTRHDAQGAWWWLINDGRIRGVLVPDNACSDSDRMRLYRYAIAAERLLGRDQRGFENPFVHAFVLRASGEILPVQRVLCVWWKEDGASIDEDPSAADDDEYDHHYEDSPGRGNRNHERLRLRAAVEAASGQQRRRRSSSATPAAAAVARAIARKRARAAAAANDD